MSVALITAIKIVLATVSILGADYLSYLPDGSERGSILLVPVATPHPSNLLILVMDSTRSWQHPPSRSNFFVAIIAKLLSPYLSHQGPADSSRHIFCFSGIPVGYKALWKIGWSTGQPSLVMESPRRTVH